MGAKVEAGLEGELVADAVSAELMCAELLDVGEAELAAGDLAEVVGAVVVADEVVHVAEVLPALAEAVAEGAGLVVPVEVRVELVGAVEAFVAELAEGVPALDVAHQGLPLALLEALLLAAAALAVGLLVHLALLVGELLHGVADAVVPVGRVLVQLRRALEEVLVAQEHLPVCEAYVAVRHLVGGAQVPLQLLQRPVRHEVPAPRVHRGPRGGLPLVLPFTFAAAASGGLLEGLRAHRAGVLEERRDGKGELGRVAEDAVEGLGRRGLGGARVAEGEGDARGGLAQQAADALGVLLGQPRHPGLDAGSRGGAGVEGGVVEVAAERQDEGRLVLLAEGAEGLVGVEQAPLEAAVGAGLLVVAGPEGVDADGVGAADTL